MSRRRTASKGDQAEQAILDHAERLLAERPLASIGIDELAAAAGISRPSFYFYFASRDAVLRVLAERITDELYQSSEAWLRPHDETPEAAIRQAIEANLALWRQHGTVLRATWNARENDPALRALWSGVSRRFIDATAAQIERERTAPAPPDARALASVLIGMNHSAFLEASTHSPRGDRELTDTLAAVWLRTVYNVSASTR